MLGELTSNERIGSLEVTCPEAHASMGFDPRQSDFKASMLADPVLLPSVTSPQFDCHFQWPLCCYSHWTFGDFISLGRAPDSTDLFIHFWNPHTFWFSGSRTPCFPFILLVTSQSCFQTSLLASKSYILRCSRVTFFAPFYPTHCPRSSFISHIPRTGSHH